LKPKNFSTDKGKYSVIATFTNRNEVTHEDDENTIRTYERPRPKLYDEMATLALFVRNYYGLETHKLRLSMIAFAENKDGHLVKFTLESVDTLKKLRVGPLVLKRELETMPGTFDRVPDSEKNALLDQVDLVENKITEYLNGDREAPVLPYIAEEPEKKQRRLPFNQLGKRLRRKKAGSD
jgi:hypothetical protein